MANQQAWDDRKKFMDWIADATAEANAFVTFDSKLQTLLNAINEDPTYHGGR